MVPLIVKSSLDMMDKWNMSLSASKKSAEIDLWEDIQPLTYDIMCKTLVVGETNKEITRIHELRDQINEQAAKVGKLMFFPGWW